MVTTVRRGVIPARLFLLCDLRTDQTTTQGIQMNSTTRTPITMPIMPPVETEKKFVIRHILCTGRKWVLHIKYVLNNE